MKHFILLLFVTLFVSVAPLRASRAVFAAAHPDIDYVGRVLKQNDGSVRFDWVGVYLRVRFTGNSCAIRASDTKNSYYCVFVDGKQLRDVNIRGNDTTIVLGDRLGDGVHTLKLYKRTEAGEGMTTLREVMLADGGTLLPWPNAPERRIEFIGNSITCGFGAESSCPNEMYTPETENAYRSYASVIARYFDADYTLIAHSGQGVVRNYGDAKPVSDYTQRHRYLQLFDAEKEPAWNFSSWRPDVVVVNLGTNDFSPGKHPTENEFVSGYKELLASIRSAYGNIPVICLSSPMSGEVQRDYVEKAAKTFDGGRNLYFLPLYSTVLNSATDIGCGHPNISGQKKIATVLIPYISSILGWEMEPKRVE